MNFADRVQETTTTTGTGTLNLAGAVTGFQTFVSGIGDGNTCYYCIDDDTDWEVGIGTVTDASPDTLSRDTVLASSNSGAAVNWGVGAKYVFVPLPSLSVDPSTVVISGLELAKNGTSDLDIASGATPDENGEVILRLGSLITKTEAAWSVGHNNGGLDSGSSYSTDTWYFVWLIRRSDTGVVDGLFSTSNSSPTMPSNYDQRSLIGAFYSDGSGEIEAFIQDGDYFWWDTRQQDLDTSAPETTWTLTTVTAPPLVGVHAIGRGISRATDASVNSTALGIHSGLSTGPSVYSEGQWITSTGNGASTTFDDVQTYVHYQTPVDSAGRIQYRADTVSNHRVFIETSGFIFPRGR